jgi:hypothetical protein
MIREENSLSDSGLQIDYDEGTTKPSKERMKSGPISNLPASIELGQRYRVTKETPREMVQMQSQPSLRRNKY